MAAGLINLATLFALPILALPAIVSGVALNRGLQYAMGLSLLAFVFLTTVFLVMLLAERPIEAIGRWVQQLRNSVVRKRPALTGLPERLSAERTQIRAALEARWGRAAVASACNWLLDYAVLMTALIAVGAQVNPAVVLIVYASTIWLAILPVTPGGVGFVEAGLLGMLMLSGVPGPQAALATLATGSSPTWHRSRSDSPPTGTRVHTGSSPPSLRSEEMPLSAESPVYEVIRHDGPFEVRRYEGYLRAVVRVRASSFLEAANSGFNPLADYIFGNNRSSDRIAMTVPVSAERAPGVKIAMTAPVTAAQAGEEYIVGFTMPSGYSME